MKKFIAEDSFWQLFPEAAIGVLVARGLKPAEEVSAEDAAEIARGLDRANVRAERFLTSGTISENEPVRVWREAYRRFKTKKGARCAIENLLKRVLKGKPVGSITPSVDIYNTVSLTYAFPTGGFDLNTIEGDYRLAVTEQGGEPFLPIGEDADDPALPGELIYLDDAGATSRCWNWRDSQRTALNDQTRDAVVVFECIEPDRLDDARAELEALADNLSRYLGAEITVSDLITADHREVVLED
ncbi:B3/B4 domain-containing protein [Collinsella vaginalis]|uniref:B3/B4 domain-containing protein n=1 Tax=Collinsella vaginalis TaxID=1870987 RepID=UPI000A268E1E|nr:phenylalanine--tRNA ligase beta subunit-related protein [Collinsella vaginalis]